MGKESFAGRIATVEMWPFKQCEYDEKVLPTVFELLIDDKTTSSDFLQLSTSQSSVHILSILSNNFCRFNNFIRMYGLNNFLSDTKANYGILINRAKELSFLLLSFLLGT